MKKNVTIRISAELMERCRNAIWALGNLRKSSRKKLNTGHLTLSKNTTTANRFRHGADGCPFEPKGE
jgi:hypothetical protein